MWVEYVNFEEKKTDGDLIRCVGKRSLLIQSTIDCRTRQPVTRLRNAGPKRR